MFRPLKEMVFPMTTVLLYIEEHKTELTRLGFETEQMRQTAQDLGQNGSIPGICLGKILGVFTSEFIISTC